MDGVCFCDKLVPAVVQIQAQSVDLDLPLDLDLEAPIESQVFDADIEIEIDTDTVGACSGAGGSEVSPPADECQWDWSSVTEEHKVRH